MEQLDPGYLRHVYDGLVSGQIHPENPSDLPEGLIGLYEEAFDESISVVARQKNLNIFCLWALLKKEVSAAFVEEILDMSEVEINLFISKYSSWFNSPVSGKYQLYHERLKVFLLQKNSEKEIQALHDKLITRIEGAIEEKKADEWECYGLEFLAQHLSINSMLSGNGEKLMKITYDHDFWERQLKISKGFIWTKKGLNATMIWAAKYNNDQVIECGLQMVDLYHIEQNAAPQIVALFAEGDIDTAMLRIESIGGNDEEAIEHRFILYILGLIELTLFNSHENSFQKVAINKILIHIDQQMPSSDCIEYFSHELLFNIFLKFKELGVDFLIIFKRLKYRIKEEIIKAAILDHFEEANYLAGLINDNIDKKRTLEIISTELIKQGRLEEALEKNSEISTVSIELAKKNEIENSLKIARRINGIDRSSLLALISIELFKLKKYKIAKSIINEAIEYSKEIAEYKNLNKITGEPFRKLNHTLNVYILSSLAFQGRIDDCFEYINQISSKIEKSQILTSISLFLSRKGKINDSKLFFNNIIDEIDEICIDESNKSNEKYIISIELYKQGDKNQAFSLIRPNNKKKFGDNIDFSEQSQLLYSISVELVKQGKTEDSEFALKEAISCIKKIDDLEWKNSQMIIFSEKLARIGKFEEAIMLAKNINFSLYQKKALFGISNILFEKGRYYDFKTLVYDALTSNNRVIDFEFNYSVLQSISLNLLRQNRVGDTEIFVDTISDHKKHQSMLLSKISTELVKQSKKEEAEIKIKESIEVAKRINDEFSIDEPLAYIYIELFLQGYKDKAISYAKEMKDIWVQGFILSSISIEIAKNGSIEEAINIAKEIEDVSEQSRAFAYISKEFAIMKDFDKAFKYAREIVYDKDWNNRALIYISIELYNQNRMEEALSIIKEVIQYYRSSSVYSANGIIAFIALEHGKQGNWYQAEVIGLEISEPKERFKCWESIGSESYKIYGFNYAFEAIYNFENNETKVHYLKGIAYAIEVHDLNEATLVKLLVNYINDYDYMKKILEKYALNKLFFSNEKLTIINRFNQSLNIKWAIDIKNKLN